MRDWIIIVALAALAFFGLRRCGCFSSSPQASAGEEESAVPADRDAARQVKLQQVAEGTSEPAGAPVSAAEQGRRQELARLTSRLLAGSDQEALDRVRGLAGPESSEPLRQLAGAVLAAFGADRITAWRGLTNVYEADLVAGSERAQMLAQTERLARLALRKPELSVVYTVVPGDSLARIRRKVREQHSINVSPGLLRWLNELRGDTIYPDQELRVPREPVELWVSLQTFRLRVYLSDGLIKEYPIGLGKDDRTPAETFVLKAPLEKAPWKDPVSGKIYHYGDPEYAIGTRWIGFEPKGPHGGLGIHGTNEPESIGKAESLGCIRMRNEHVEELADLVAPGLSIQIVD